VDNPESKTKDEGKNFKEIRKRSFQMRIYWQTCQRVIKRSLTRLLAKPIPPIILWDVPFKVLVNWIMLKSLKPKTKSLKSETKIACLKKGGILFLVYPRFASKIKKHKDGANDEAECHKDH